MDERNRRKYLIGITVFFIYIIFSITITFPLILNLKKGLWVGYGDIFGGVWGQWIFNEHIPDSKGFTDIIAFPFGIDTKGTIYQPVWGTIYRILNILFGEITSYNLIVLFAFPLTSFCTYLLFNYLGYKKLPSFIGGFIFGFNPSAFFQSIGGHMAFSLNFMIPFLLMALFNNKKKRTFWSAVIVGLVFFLVVEFNSFYFGYFSIFILILFIIFDYITSKNDIRIFLKNYGILLLTSLVIIIAFQYKVIIEQFTKPVEKLVETGYRRSLDELYVLSSRLWEFFIPQVTHPVFGNIFKDFTRIRHQYCNLFEHTLYLGYTPFVVLLLAFYLLGKKHLNKKDKTLFFFFLSGFILMIILSLPPSVNIFGLRIPLLSSFLFKIAPMFRVYSRAVILSVIFLSGITVLFLDKISRLVKKQIYIIISIIVFIFVAFEYLEYSGDLIFDTKSVPIVYKWLSEDRGSKVIAEYPMMRSDESSYYTYLYYQRIHKKKLVNGAKPGTEAWDFFEKVNNISNPQTVRLLREIGTDYVIIHFDKYKEGPTPYPLKRFVANISVTYNNGNPPVIPCELNLYKDFGSTKVYVLE